MLLVHGFGQNRYAWHLPSRSFANHLAASGFDVFNLDLRGHGRSRHFGARRAHGVQDYVREDLPAAVEEVQALSGGRGVWLVGHSLGGLVSYAAAPTLGGAVSGIVSIGSPYHFTRGSLTLGALTLLLPRAGARAASQRGPAARARRRSPCASSAASPRARSTPSRCAAGTPGRASPHVLEQHLRLAFDRAALAEMVDMFDWASAAPLRRTRLGLRRALREAGPARCSSSPAPTTTSPHRPASAPASPAAARATRPTACCPWAHRPARRPRRAPDDVAPRHQVADRALAEKAA